MRPQYAAINAVAASFDAPQVCRRGAKSRRLKVNDRQLLSARVGCSARIGCSARVDCSVGSSLRMREAATRAERATLACNLFTHEFRRYSLSAHRTDKLERPSALRIARSDRASARGRQADHPAAKICNVDTHDDYLRTQQNLRVADENIHEEALRDEHSIIGVLATNIAIFVIAHDHRVFFRRNAQNVAIIVAHDTSTVYAPRRRPHEPIFRLQIKQNMLKNCAVKTAKIVNAPDRRSNCRRCAESRIEIVAQKRVHPSGRVRQKNRRRCAARGTKTSSGDRV